MEKTLGKKRSQGNRLDTWLSRAFPELSNRQIREAIEQQLVTGPKGQVLKKGDSLSLEPNVEKLAEHLEKLWQGNKKIRNVEIVHEEKDFIVIDKPSGLPSHPLGLFDSKNVTQWALANYPELRAEFQDTFQPTLCPHRLDTDTSGLLIICLKKKSYERWRKVFSNGKVSKTYLAWCWGRPDKSKWLEVSSIAHDKRDSSKMVAVKNGSTPHRPPVLEAKTKFKVVKRLADRFLVEAEMESGVTHQVRVHLTLAGYPLLGDKKYDPLWEKRPEKVVGHKLRACRIECSEYEGRSHWVLKAECSKFAKMY